MHYRIIIKKFDEFNEHEKSMSFTDRKKIVQFGVKF